MRRCSNAKMAGLQAEQDVNPSEVLVDIMEVDRQGTEADRVEKRRASRNCQTEVECSFWNGAGNVGFEVKRGRILEGFN